MSNPGACDARDACEALIVERDRIRIRTVELQGRGDLLLTEIAMLRDLAGRQMDEIARLRGADRFPVHRLAGHPWRTCGGRLGRTGQWEHCPFAVVSDYQHGFAVVVEPHA